MSGHGCMKCARGSYDTKEFIKRSKIKHGELYDYQGTIYENSSKKVNIKCNECNEIFNMIPNNHLTGSGCRVCTNKKMSIVNTSNTEKFIEKSLKIHGQLYDYSLINYINSVTPVEIICKEHGEFKISPNSHLSGTRCSICAHKLKGVFGNLSQKEFKARLYKLSPELVVKGKYKNSRTKILVSDSKWDYLAFPTSLLSGYKPSPNKIVQKNEYIKERFIKKHGKKYNYDLVNYKTIRKKVIIECKKHGKFKQLVSVHLRGSGCSKCALKGGGWTYTQWERVAKKSINFDSFKVYIIKCWNDTEEFYKIGKTFMTIDNRFRGKNRMPYKYKVLKVIKQGTARKLSELEITLMKTNKEFKYTPQIKFRGMTECFTKINK
jgi:hypothetical protein